MAIYGGTEVWLLSTCIVDEQTTQKLFFIIAALLGHLALRFTNLSPGLAGVIAAGNYCEKLILTAADQHDYRNYVRSSYSQRPISTTIGIM